MRNQLFEMSKINKKIIGVRMYEDEDNFWLGYIENYNDEIIQLRQFDTFGFDDGIFVEKQENIESIDFNSDYEKTYEYLINSIYNLNEIEEIVSFKNSVNWKKEYLEEFKQRNEVISFQFGKGDTIYGYIENLTDKELIINAIGRLGEDEGKTIYKIDEIKALEFASRKSKLRKELNKWRKEKTTATTK
jgi:hypothetical protein